MTAPYKNSRRGVEDHFMTDKGKIRWIYTREKDDSPITSCRSGLKRRDPADHVHRTSRSDLCDRGQGHHVHRRGRPVSVSRDGGSSPPEHQTCIRNVEQDLLIYNVFAPAMKYMKGGNSVCRSTTSSWSVPHCGHHDCPGAFEAKGPIRSDRQGTVPVLCRFQSRTLPDPSS